MRIAFLSAMLVPILAISAYPQKAAKGAGSKAVEALAVKQIDEKALTKLLVPSGKPLLVNFWATWCDPCREEFPDLVILDEEYKGRIDFITVSLDDPADITTTVPRFLRSMKAQMPAYLLKTADESAVITSISKDWRGGMPFTALYDATGSLVYFREGKVIMPKMREELNKLMPTVARAN